MTDQATIAELLRDDAYDSNRLMPKVAPGSFEEEAALDAIDNARAAETAKLGDTFAARQKRRAASWRPRGVRS